MEEDATTTANEENLTSKVQPGTDGAKSKVTKVPPIILLSPVEDYLQLINVIHDENQAEPRIKRNSKSTRTTIYTDKLEHHEKIKTLLAGADIPFYTYSMKTQKPKKLVIHGL